MIELLEILTPNTPLDHIPPEVWIDWENSPVTKHLEQRLLEEMVKAFDNLVDGDEKLDPFFRGQLNSLELAITYKPENVNDKQHEEGEAD